MFPRDLDPQYFDQEFRLKPELWRDAFLQLWQEKGPRGSVAFHAFKDGTNLIAAFGDWILKVFPPFLNNQFVSESRVLEQLQGLADVPIPRLHSAGTCGEGWTYIIMSRLPGITLESAWPRLPDSDKAAILQHIGAIMARVHALPVGDLHSLPPDWAEFFPKQISGCRARHERLKMPDWFVENVDSFVQSALPLLPAQFTPVILTGEYTPFNLLVLDKPQIQSIAGMIDFGDAMIGYAAYDLLGPLLFSCEGKGELVSALLTGYGIPRAEQNRTLRRRLFLLQILHRYSYFHAQVRIPDWTSRVHSIEELEQLIWPMDGSSGT